jgi:hypothetical protein
MNIGLGKANDLLNDDVLYNSLILSVLGSVTRYSDENTVEKVGRTSMYGEYSIMQ